MKLEDLENEVRKAIDGEQEGNMENLRNEGKSIILATEYNLLLIHLIFNLVNHNHTVIAKTLLDSMVVSKIPESLIDETVQSRFQNMLAGQFH
jgi:hypothetical protein